jgi:pimeloyl-ACP methyl ester carboxylesterase
MIMTVLHIFLGPSAFRGGRAAWWAVLVASMLTVSCAIPPALVFRRPPALVVAPSEEAKLHAWTAKALESRDPEKSRRALGLLMEHWKKRGLGDEHTLRPAAGGGPAFRIRLSGGDDAGCYPLDYFDALSPADELRVARIHRYRQDGIGAPLVAVRENRGRDPIEQFYPPEAITRALTAHLEAGPEKDGVREVEIRLLCPLVHHEVEGPGGPQLLAADYTAPWATLLSRTGPLHARGVLDALTPTPSRPSRLYLMQPYDPKKEPLLMIHGLYATPLIWARISNELWGEPEIRQRYQIWHYHYNTSAPALYSARLLRAQLAELRTLLDPDGNDPAMRRMTLLAHSMGGLISKALVVRPGDAYWDAAFTVPPASLKLSPEDRAMLEDAFEWEPIPAIHRIIFVAVPHRGSAYADNFIGRIGRSLTSAPSGFQEFYRRISTSNPGAFTPAYAELGEGRLNSVGSLSPNQPTLKILADLPFAHPVKVYSIIGNRGLPGPLETSSDGVVPYTSSHLKDAESELVVPTNHWTYKHPAAIEEIKRILRMR